MLSYVKPLPARGSDPAKSPRTIAFAGGRVRTRWFHQHSESTGFPGHVGFPGAPSEGGLGLKHNFCPQTASRRPGFLQSPPSKPGGRPTGGPRSSLEAAAAGPRSVLRDPTLLCAKDTSVGSAGPFYATAAPLYDPSPRSEWVSWRPAGSWQELPTELGEVTKAEQEVAQLDGGEP